MMKYYRHIIYLAILFCCFSVSIEAQVPIENLLNKYQDLVKIGKLKTFNLKPEELKATKQVSLNLGEYQKNLILGTDEQYTLIYTGSNPSLNNFYDEAVTILKDKDYILSKNSTIGEMKNTTYTLVENSYIKELITLTKNSDSVTILVSKGNFGINQRQKTEDSNKTN